MSSNVIKEIGKKVWKEIYALWYQQTSCYVSRKEQSNKEPDTYVQLSGRCDRAYNMLCNYFMRIRRNAFGLQKFWEFSQPPVHAAEKKTTKTKTTKNNFHTLAVNWWSSTTKTLLKYILFLEPSKLVKCHVSIHVHTCRCGWAVSSA